LIATRVDLEIRQLTVYPGPAYGASLPLREICYTRNPDHVAAPRIAAEQGRWPHVEVDRARSNEPELLLVICDCGREPGVHAAVQTPDFEGMLKGLQRLAERDVVRCWAAYATRDAVDAVGLMFEYLAGQVGVFDGDPRAFHGQSSSSATE
jgi:hypothetical protein